MNADATTLNRMKNDPKHNMHIPFTLQGVLYNASSFLSPKKCPSETNLEQERCGADINTELLQEGGAQFTAPTFCLCMDPPSGMVEDYGPVLLDGGALLVRRTFYVTLDVHAAACRATAGDEHWTTQGLVASGARDVIQADTEICHGVDDDRLEEDPEAILAGAQLVNSPAFGTGGGEANVYLVALLDIRGRSEQRFLGALFGHFCQEGTRRPLQPQIVPIAAGPARPTMDQGVVGLPDCGQRFE
jgi:hypothetical protein